MSKTVVLIDGDNMLHRAYHKFGGFSSKGGDPSSIIFGLPYMLKPLIIKFKPTEVVGIFDGGRNPERLKVLPTYKEREKREDFDVEGFEKQKEEVIELIRNMNVYTFRRRHQEADDWIYTFTRYYVNQGYKVIIVSSDKDFHQLITETVSVYSPAKEHLLTTKNLKRLVGYEPWECVDWLILDGDKSDKIPGYPQMGEKRIRQFLDEHKSIKAYIASGFKGKVDPKALKILYNKNRLLIDLAYFYRKFNRKETIPWKEMEPIFNMIHIAKVSRQYNVTTLLKTDFLKAFKDLV